MSKLVTKLSKNFDKVFEEGRKKVMEGLVKSDTMLLVCEKYAEIAIQEAVLNYDASTTPEQNLTGNTRTSFCAGIYLSGRCIGTIRVLDYIDDRYTFHYAKVGDSNFYDYGSREWIGSKQDSSVKEYSDGNRFQPTTDGYAYRDTLNFLEAYKCSNDGYSVVVASISPYVEYIKEIKSLDILDRNWIDKDRVMKEAFEMTSHIRMTLSNTI